LAKYPDAPVEEICGGCAKKETKPGQQPRRLADAIAEAISLDEIKACGGTFAYPDSLTAYQWSCIRSLERARQKDQEREQRKQQQQSEQAALQARMKLVWIRETRNDPRNSWRPPYAPPLMGLCRKLARPVGVLAMPSLEG